MTCDKCNEERAEHKKFCSSCGADLTVPNGAAPCDYCSKSKELGHTFCSVCGRELSSDPAPQICSECDEYRDAGYRFCAKCGRDLKLNESVLSRISPAKKVMFGVSTAAVAMSVFIMLFEAFTGTFKLPAVMEGLEGHTYDLFILTPFVTDLFTIGDVGSRIIYIVELIIVIACIATLLYTAFRKYKKTGDIYALRETGLYEVICLNGIMLVFQMIYIVICSSMGVDMGDVSLGETAKAMFSLMNASVYEEFLCRICLLGLPIAIVYLIMGKKDVPFYRYLLGGFEFKRWMLVFVLLSAAVFALGHLTGWGWWKIVPTFVFGLITAYVFIKYGVYATISIHFMTDFIVSETWLFGTSSAVVMSSLMLLAGLLAFSAVPYYYRKVRGIVSGWGSADKRS